MTDIVDQAKERELFHRAQALAAAKANAVEPEQLIIGHEVVCLDCEEPIPELRLLAKPDAVRCIDCQSLKEA